MLDEIATVDRAENRVSQNRVAVKQDLRASVTSSRAAVRSDLRSGALPAAMEQSDENSSDEEGKDPFHDLLRERTMRTGSTAVIPEKRPSRFVDPETAKQA